jgi:hypothetical protein
MATPRIEINNGDRYIYRTGERLGSVRLDGLIPIEPTGVRSFPKATTPPALIIDYYRLP